MVRFAYKLVTVCAIGHFLYTVNPSLQAMADLSPLLSFYYFIIS